MVSRKEISKILTIFDEIKEDHGITLLVYGKEGSGKSYVLDEVMKILQSKGVICLKEALKESKPFIFSKILEQAKKQVSTIPNSGILSYLISSTEPFSQSEKMFLKLTESLTILSNAKPVLIFLDDLDSCETSSLNIFSKVARFISNKNIMLVATYTDMPKTGYFENIITQLRTNTNLLELNIEPLKRDEIKDLLDNLGYKIPTYIIDYIYRDSGGIPANIFRILKETEKNGNLDNKKIWVGHYPGTISRDTVEKKIKNRIEKLNNDQLAVLKSVAVLDNNATTELLMYMTGFDEMKLSEILDLLIRYELLIEDKEHFKIVPNALKEYIYESIPIEERKNLHKKFAEWLEISGEDVILLSDQFYLAHINDKALKYLKNAGLLLMRLERYDSALNRFLKAQSIASNNDPELLMYTGLTYRYLGDYKKSVEYLENSLKFATDTLLNQIEIELSNSYVEVGMFDKAIQYYRKLEAITKDKSQIINIYFGLYTIFWRRNDYTNAREYISKALKIANELDNTKLIADSYRYLGNIEYNLDNYNIAMLNYEKALELYSKINSADGLLNNYNNIANVYADTGSLDKSIEYYEKAAYYSDLLGEEGTLSTIYYNLAELNFQRSKLSLFLKYLQESKKIAERMNSPNLLNLINILYGSYYTFRGEFEEAMKQFRKSAEINEMMGDKYSFYRNQVRIENLIILTGGKVDKIEVEKLKNNLGAAMPENSEIEILLFETFISFTKSDFKKTITLSRKIETKAKNKFEIIDGLIYQFFAELYFGETSKSHDIYEKIEQLHKQLGVEILEAKKIKVCAEYLRNRSTAGSMFSELDNFLDTYDLKFEKGKLYMWYGLLKLRFEQDDSYLKHSLTIFEKINAKAYWSMANHYLKDQNQSPK
ncbi:MAG: AAA family ATPase [Thermoplasmata archaeon]